MLEDIRVQRPDHAQIVGQGAQVREQFADHQTASTARAELKRRADQIEFLVRHVAQLSAADFLAVVGLKLRFVVKRIDVRDAARQEDDDQILGPSGKVGPLGHQRASFIPLRGQRQERIQPQAAGSAALQEVATRQEFALH